MPELPEVETLARGLQREVAGSRVLSVELGKTEFMDNPAEIERELAGTRIERVERYGKFMLLRLERAAGADGVAQESALLVHLGMTGTMVPRPASEPRAKHTHLVALLEDGRELRYIDPRRFGRIAWLAGEKLRKELLRFGADPLLISQEEFVQRIRGRRARIKAMLLDQGVLRGVGNIYADESLWKAKIHPARIGARLTVEEAKTLHAALQQILKKAIVLRGSSISDFLDAEGEPGEYQLHHKAYGREGKACYRCKTPIRRIVVAGRSSFFCPSCQKAPRGMKRGRRTKPVPRRGASKVAAKVAVGKG
ncbi:MAG TPA: bifunctional DNA-formamidopyrimidine glycosylase/DNA-(apurinic or apyrimidinic site) lyase [Candidatus Limnocylindrales bacterium]|nr:bifunctional DNA-formamidopyrimidine glycosylase/DNA-(apurinic or apyrimidinic site) lyase [Candidatus Limnocylindrales bacterium]